ncbi:MAG: pilus assembly protein [Bdellovibrionales bacterium]|nr:pilus assembly protein [Bdellovibrionales bacterium]
MLEFAIIVPVLILLIVAGFVLSNALRKHETASGFSREAASRAYRECSAEIGETSALACLTTVERQLEAELIELYSGSEIITSLYRFEMPGTPCPTTFSPFAATTPERFHSRLASQDAVAANGIIDPELICETRAVAVAEVFIPQDDLFGRLGAIFFFQPEQFYNVSIL